jgi:hypothetical protein
MREPVGFRIVKQVGLGSAWIAKPARALNRLFHAQGPLLALPLFLVTIPLQALDYANPAVPVSLYVQAVRESK